MIKDIGHIDILSRKQDGSVRMTIVSHGGLDGGRRTAEKLRRKVESYLLYMNSSRFFKDHPKAQGRAVIVLSLDEEPTAAVLQQCKKMALLCRKNGADFEIEVRPSGFGRA